MLVQQNMFDITEKEHTYLHNERLESIEKI